MDTLSFDQVRGLVRDALISAYGDYQWIVAIYPGSVVFESGSGDMAMESGARKLFRVSYAIGSDNAVTLADDKQEVKETLEYEPVKAATFSIDSESTTEGEFVLRSGKVFEAGDYPDKDFSIDESELDLAVASFSPVPNDLEHRPTILSGKVGTLEGIKREGKDLLGTVKIPKWLDSLIGADPLKVSVAFDRATKRIVGNALTVQPRVGDAQVLAAFNKSAIPRKGSPMKKLLQALAAQFSQAAAEAEDEQPGTPAVVPEVPKPSDKSAEFAALKARTEALEAQLKAESDRKVAEAAAAFAKEAVESRRALPNEAERLSAMFTQALLDDNSGTVTFSDGVPTEGDRVANLRALINARIPHTLTEEKLAKFATVPCEGGDVPKTPAINTSAIYDDMNGRGK